VKGTFQKVDWSEGVQVARTELSLPRKGPAVLGVVGLDLQTPCGQKLLPLAVEQTAADEQEARANRVSFYVDVRADPLPGGVDVLVDRTKSPAVQVGKLSITAERTTLHELGCAGGPVEVTVAGQKVATAVPAAVAGKQSLFITPDAAACYSSQLVSYGVDPGSGRSILTGKNVYWIGGLVEHFMRPAPEKSRLGDARYELVSTPCPSPGPPPN
jgi:hypothetical protein